MGLVDDFVKLPDAFKYGIVLLASLVTTISFFGLNISDLILIPLFNTFGGSLSVLSGFPVNTDYRLAIIILWLIVVLLFIGFFNKN